MKKNWLKITLIALVLIAGIIFLARYKKNGGDLTELAEETLQVLTENESPNQDNGIQEEIPLLTDEPEIQEVQVQEKEEGYLVSVQGEESRFYKKDSVKKDGTYDSRDKVAIYIYCFKTLPSNYITKKKAQELGWQGGSLDSVAKGKSIGGDRFGNYEGLLPKEKGRNYTECDIDTRGKSSRGAKRIVFSNDGHIYYTPDHYSSFSEIIVKEE